MKFILFLIIILSICNCRKPQLVNHLEPMIIETTVESSNILQDTHNRHSVEPEISTSFEKEPVTNNGVQPRHYQSKASSDGLDLTETYETVQHGQVSTSYTSEDSSLMFNEQTQNSNNNASPTQNNQQDNTFNSQANPIYYQQNVLSSSCGCASLIPPSCPPCTRVPSVAIVHQVEALQTCACAASKPHCDLCPQLLEAVHELGVRTASAHESNQNNMKNRAKQQAHLYEVGQQWATEMKNQEALALSAAKAMNLASKRAHDAYMQMNEVNAQANSLALPPVQIVEPVAIQQAPVVVPQPVVHVYNPLSVGPAQPTFVPQLPPVYHGGFQSAAIPLSNVANGLTVTTSAQGMISPIIAHEEQGYDSFEQQLQQELITQPNLRFKNVSKKNIKKQEKK